MRRFRPVATPGRAAGRASDLLGARRPDPLLALPVPFDDFALAVPESGFEIGLLYKGQAQAHAVEHLQLLLRGLCSFGHQVSRVTMQGDRIDLQVNACRLIFGEMHNVRNLPLWRPALPGAQLQSGRLGHVLQHHDMCLRLRLSLDAGAALIEQLTRLLIEIHAPRAVILWPQGVILTLSEFASRSLAELRALTRGAPALKLVSRLDRPEIPLPASATGADEPTPSRAPAPAPKPRPRMTVFRKTRHPSDRATQSLDRVISTCTDQQAQDALRMAFRKGSRTLVTQAPHSPATALASGSAHAGSHRHSRFPVLLPILLAALILFGEIAAQSLGLLTPVSPGAANSAGCDHSTNTLSATSCVSGSASVVKAANDI
ncbi:MAG: hypothetical protein ACXIU7_09750 [Roseinatronobacter sp.]